MPLSWSNWKPCFAPLELQVDLTENLVCSLRLLGINKYIVFATGACVALLSRNHATKLPLREIISALTCSWVHAAGPSGLRSGMRVCGAERHVGASLGCPGVRMSGGVRCATWGRRCVDAQVLAGWVCGSELLGCAGLSYLGGRV